jgi:hypothetical protein
VVISGKTTSYNLISVNIFYHILYHQYWPGKNCPGDHSALVVSRIADIKRLKM